MIQKSQWLNPMKVHFSLTQSLFQMFLVGELVALLQGVIQESRLLPTVDITIFDMWTPVTQRKVKDCKGGIWWPTSFNFIFYYPELVSRGCKDTLTAHQHSICRSTRLRCPTGHLFLPHTPSVIRISLYFKCLSICPLCSQSLSST